MFDNFKAYVMELFSTDDTKEAPFTPRKEEPVDTWAFCMVTQPYFSGTEEADIPSKHSHILGEQVTWMEVVDKILDEMGKHYGYNIKEQVYYSVNYPLNDINRETGEPYAGYGRCLNDEKLQLLLLSHPELYESGPPFERKII